MNQSILFPEHESWCEERQAICFHAMVNGFQVNCAMSADRMSSLYGGHTPQEWLMLFQRHRWDIEEQIELAISNDQDDDEGWYWLS